MHQLLNQDTFTNGTNVSYSIKEIIRNFRKIFPLAYRLQLIKSKVHGMKMEKGPPFGTRIPTCIRNESQTIQTVMTLQSLIIVLLKIWSH